jgi:hypothetical protein
VDEILGVSGAFVGLLVEQADKHIEDEAKCHRSENLTGLRGDFSGLGNSVEEAVNGCSDNGVHKVIVFRCGEV